MSDELKPKASIASDMRFHALVMDVYAAEVEFAAAAASGGDTYAGFEKASIARLALIDHINTWAARLAATPDGMKVVPIEPTEDMVTQGFESWPDPFFSKPDEWAAYEEMTGCQKAAYRAKLCWRAMLAAVPGLDKENA